MLFGTFNPAHALRPPSPASPIRPPCSRSGRRRWGTPCRSPGSPAACGRRWSSATRRRLTWPRPCCWVWTLVLGAVGWRLFNAARARRAPPWIARGLLMPPHDVCRDFDSRAGWRCGPRFCAEWQQVGRAEGPLGGRPDQYRGGPPPACCWRNWHSAAKGFAASGGSEHVVAFIALGMDGACMSPKVQTTVRTRKAICATRNETGVLPHLWTTRVARWVPVVGITLFELVDHARSGRSVILVDRGADFAWRGLPAVSLLSIPAIAAERDRLLRNRAGHGR